MQTGKNNPWDDFVDKAMQQTGPVDPGSEFTDMVMASIQNQKATETITAYKPPISKLSWIVIAALFAGILSWSSVFGLKLEWGWIRILDQSAGIQELLSAIEFPDPGTTTAYSIGICALFICIQVLLMKRRLDRQIQLN